MFTSRPAFPSKLLSRGGKDIGMPALLLVSAFLVVAPLDAVQLLFAAVGAVVYVLMNLSPGGTRGPLKKWQVTAKKTQKANKVLQQESRCGRALSSKPKQARQQPAAVPVLNNAARDATAAKCEVWTPSVVAVAPPKFSAPDFDAQVNELVAQISPCAESQRLVDELGHSVRTNIQKMFPNVDVVCFASGSVTGEGSAFGVAVPEVDIVARISPNALLERFGGRGHGAGRRQKVGERGLQKFAIRTCTELLVGSGDFRFRRSAFRGLEPKVTLLAPGRAHGRSIPVDFSVNSVIPLHNAVLLTECGQIEPRSRDLITVVRRWAKDRGICHAAKGHLPPYAWSLLVIYFLQVGNRDEGPLLPPLEEFALSSGLMGKPPMEKSSSDKPNPQHAAAKGNPASVSKLFKEFIRFYHTGLDWRKEAVSVRFGRRAPPDRALGFNVVMRAGGAVEVAPTVEDPLCPGRNVAAGCTAGSLDRFREELARADELCARGASLTELLEPWKPTEGEQEDEEKAAEDSPVSEPGSGKERV